MTLSKQDIFSAAPRTLELPVPEWGGSIKVRPVTLEEQGKLSDLAKRHASSNAITKLKECTLPLLQWTILDEEGKPLFTKEELVELMNHTPAAAVLRIQDFVLNQSGLTEESRRALEKNLRTTSDSEASS